ncbi:Sec7 domain-containing protein [Verticillium alfalfae VaMs.102]|uniref:Sec7 domain-containing protein n=1 Tax=Verticillium alfalfae (strain VaMs.102 / ATCC MYA-4576 / FGSC 10136) TaxID=526221 RepID=C9SD58_VERA1|nr:Sec7 domain-containing protein [Verticillium alfalfae VaMs.102]EEY17023.1 Sec7 domain-containing protein [Verticillium alfalfae VaMs.102]
MSGDTSTQRRRRRPDLNIDTSPKHDSNTHAVSRDKSLCDADPLTPPGKSKTSAPLPKKPAPRALKAPSYSTHNADDSFLETPTPIDTDMSNKENTNPAYSRARDSHDLSLPARQVTRDSLMTNMLMSLDQFSMPSLGTNASGSGTISGNGKGALFDDASQGYVYNSDADPLARATAGRDRRANGHGYSYSSDFDGADDSSRYSSQHSRGRRSNSSSNFQTNLGRINSIRSTPGTPRHMHSRGGGKGSKSSSTNSVDAGYAQVLSSQRWAHGFGKRSSSFDYGHRPQITTNNSQQAPWHVEFSNTFLSDDYDAAPTPTVPGGPRRFPVITSPTFPPVPPEPIEPQAPALERKRSARSAKSTATSRKTDSKSNTMTRESIPQNTPTPEPDSAPAPHIGYEKTKVAVHGAPAPTQPPSQTKERPGFFRRVFGSSKSNAASNNVEPAQASVTDTENRPGSRPQNGASQAKSQSTPPSRDTSSSQSHQPVLHKKPSSFFRRRKKSNAEPPVPPVPAPSIEPPMPSAVPPPFLIPPSKDKLAVKPEPSPVSSLRRVMNPYLKGSPVTPNAPHPFQTTAQNAEASPEPEVRRNDTPTRPPPEVPQPIGKRDDSFLNLDGSDDNEVEGSTKYKTASTERMRKASKELLSAPALAPPVVKENAHRARMPKANETEVVDSEDENRSTLVLPLEGARSASIRSGSTGTEYKSALQTPSVTVEDSSKMLDSMNGKPLDEPEFVVGDPTDDDRQKAQKIYDGNEDFIQKEKAAAWMGEEGLVRQRTLQAYMELYDFANKSVVQALRQVCERLVFRAETQQVDRILVAFSKRWCDCNPNHGFKASDLHLADIEFKMTRSQFVKNTITTIIQAVGEAAPNAFKRPSILPEKDSLHATNEDVRPSADERSNRFSFKPAPRREPSADGAEGVEKDECGPLVKAPFGGTMRAWEAQVEIVLKLIYASIRDERLPLFGAEPSRNLGPTSYSNLSVMGMLKRSPSVLSKAPSESHSSIRGRLAENSRTNTARFGSKSRSRPRLGHNGFSSSRTSFDDGNSIWSPTPSSATWSRYSLGRTQGSMSMDSFGTPFPRGDYQQSIGFANALSQAIIRDDASGFGPAASIMSDEAHVPLLEDESLELAGPPWVKEGMVTHKHHLDGVAKKAKDRNWTEVFAVVQKGQMSLFSFTANKSMGRKSKMARNAAKSSTVAVGGGNWQDNATNLGTFSLRQTLASALPSPGYSRTRPHVWALSLPTGAVHLFQVGTPEISKEFVTTANYWSARLSTHPLIGGISNIEYGWSDAIINNALVTAIHESTGGAPPSGRTSRPGSSATANASNPPAARTSMQSSRSFRSASFDYPSGSYGSGNRGPEAEQLLTLLAYVKGVEDELQVHNSLRSPMLLAFTPRGHNAGRAMANWERKSSYLLREIVKFRTYVDCLQQADTRREEIYNERDTARRAALGDLSDEEVEVAADGDATLRA